MSAWCGGTWTPERPRRNWGAGRRQYAGVDVSKLDTPEPYTPAPVGRRETVDLRRLLSHAASGEGTIGAAIDADTYHKMLAISK